MENLPYVVRKTIYRNLGFNDKRRFRLAAPHMTDIYRKFTFLSNNVTKSELLANKSITFSCPLCQFDGLAEFMQEDWNPSYERYPPIARSVLQLPSFPQYVLNLIFKLGLSKLQTQKFTISELKIHIRNHFPCGNRTKNVNLFVLPVQAINTFDAVHAALNYTLEIFEEMARAGEPWPKVNNRTQKDFDALCDFFIFFQRLGLNEDLTVVFDLFSPFFEKDKFEFMSLLEFCILENDKWESPHCLSLLDKGVSVDLFDVFESKHPLGDTFEERMLLLNQ